MERWRQLLLFQKAGLITDLKRQVRYQLIPYQPEFKLKGVSYVADFDYYENGQHIVEDAKGYRTRDYIIKRKLMAFVHGILVKEV